MKQPDFDQGDDLLGRYGPELLLFARQWVDIYADAEDVVQDGFVRYWKKRRGVDDPAAYLFICVKSCALQWVRGEARRKRRELKAAECGGESQGMFELGLVEDERRVAIEKALVDLPVEQREVVVLKLWSGLTFEQIGKVAGVSVNTAASRYGLKALKGVLSKEMLI